MQGIGNDFVVVNHADVKGADLSALAKWVSNRRTGVGADGLLVLNSNPLEMHMWNPDGSEAEMCGNGVRCAAKRFADLGWSESEFEIGTGAGPIRLKVLADGRVAVEMGQAKFLRGEIGMNGPSDQEFLDQPLEGGLKGTAVSMGNPHLVIPVADVAAVDLAFVGPRLERLALFPNRVNVHFVQVLSRQKLLQRTWERGAGITLACGTGACAVAAASWKLGLSEKSVDVKLPGGHLQIDVGDDFSVTMTGPAVKVFEGALP